MIEVIIGADSQNTGLLLGYAGENEARAVSFDFSAWQEEYGDGTFSLFVQRPRECEAYPVALTIDGTTAVWEPDSTDTQYSGYGKIQAVYAVGTTVVKERIYKVQIADSLGQGETPEPWESYIEQVATLADTISNAAEQAQASADEASSYADAASASADEAADAAVIVTGDFEQGFLDGLNTAM